VVQLIGLLSDLTLANLEFMDVKSMIRVRTGPAEILQPDASSIATAAVLPTLTPAGESALVVPSSGFPPVVRAEPWPASPRRWRKGRQ